MDFGLLLLSLIANGLDPSDPTFVFLFRVAVLIMLLAGCVFALWARVILPDRLSEKLMK